MVHSIVTGYGGAITLESASGLKTRFDLNFPRCDDMANTLPTPHAAIHGHGKHILRVDDEPAPVRLWAVPLMELGYHVTACTNSREAPDTFDLVVTNQNMPQLTGESLVRLF
ncbi:MAG TPA: hybrid sensor histidine kinase/response regulator, partial [Candidatus Methylomirabilis sp.]